MSETVSSRASPRTLPSFVFTYSEPLAVSGGGFTLADFELSGDAGCFSTRGRVPDRSVLLAPALADLLQCLTGLFEHSGGRTRVFDAASTSPLSVVFMRRGDRISAGVGGRCIHDDTIGAWRASVHRDLMPLASEVLRRVPSGDSSTADLVDALAGAVRARL